MKEVEIYLAMERLRRLADEEITSEIGLREPIEGIIELLRDNQSKLKKAYPSQIDEIDELTTKIDEAAYATENAIDYHGLRIYDNNNNNSRKGSKRYLGLISSCLSSKPLHDPPNTLFKYELKGLHDQYKNALQLLSYHEPRLVLTDQEDQHRGILHYCKHPDRDTVRLNEVVKCEVIKRLVDRSRELELVSLCGVGGSGKTTLAYQVYNDREITFGFFNAIWIHVSSKFNTREMFLYILSYFRERPHEYISESEDYLVKEIGRYISKSGKSLIVLDDVWSTQVLDEIRRVFPNDHAGHRVLLTTRKTQVAEYGYPKPSVVTVRGQSEDGSWELFMDEYRRHTREGKEIQLEMLDIGRRMVKRCEGLSVLG